MGNAPQDPFQDPSATAKLEQSTETTAFPAPSPSASSGAPVSRTSETVASDNTVFVASPGGPAPPAIPDVQLEKLLGQGGMGAVYRGRQITLERPVAVKVIKPDLARDDSFVKRFEREAKVLAKLSHPNIVGCYQAGKATSGEHYLLMEFVEGEDLRHRVEKDAPMSEIEALVLVRQVADALAHALEAGVIHRDVKPENILLKAAPKGSPVASQAKLVDLGLASLARANSEAARITEAGTAVGTPVTMAPEQADSPDTIDHRADVYALGCTLYYALAKRFPHEGGTVAQVIAKKLRGETPSPRQFRADLHEPVVKLILDMIALRAEDRPASYEVLLERIDAALASLPASGPITAKLKPPTSGLAIPQVAGETATFAPQKGEPARSGPGALVPVLAVAVLGLGAFGAYHLTHEHEEHGVTATPSPGPVASASPVAVSSPVPTPAATVPTPAAPALREPPVRGWSERPTFFKKNGLFSLDGWTATPPEKVWVDHNTGAETEYNADLDARLTASVSFAKILWTEDPPAEWALKCEIYARAVDQSGIWVETADGTAARIALSSYATTTLAKIDAVEADGSRPRPKDALSFDKGLSVTESVKVQACFVDGRLWARLVGLEGKAKEGPRTWMSAPLPKPTKLGLFASGKGAAIFQNVELSDAR